MSWWRFVLGLPDRTQKTGLNKAQLEWARRVFSYRFGELVCFFPVFSGDSYTYCMGTHRIQIHHILPKGFGKTEGLFSDPDRPENLLACCSLHHVGRGYKGTLNVREHVVPVIHPDMAYSYRHYGEKGREAFEEVFRARDERTAEGKKYWNTFWDGLLREIAEAEVSNYLYNFPDDIFPSRRK